MRKRIEDFEVVSNKKVGRDHFVLYLKSDAALPEIMPGQFAEIRVDGAPDVFLRRPVSVHDVDYDKQILILYIKIAGKGTFKLSQLAAGEKLNLVYPLGNSFNLKGIKKALLAGGGCGIAPLMFLARCLNDQNVSSDILLGGRSACDIHEVDKFFAFGSVMFSTDDGTLGEKGFVSLHPVLKEISQYDRVYCCGPLPMMQSVAAIAKSANVDCEVSLENTMACGIGACLCCITETTDGNKCVCTEGPVFNIKKLKWQI